MVPFPRSGVPASPPTGPEVGDVVAAGRYRLLEHLGEGGLGNVFRAVDPAGLSVALKVLIPRYRGRPEREQRLLDEQRYIEQVGDRRHVVGAIEGGRLEEWGGWPYLVMEYLPGSSLFARFIRQPSLTVAERIEIALQIAKGLRSIHAAGVIHRDLSPRNVLLVQRGQALTVKIIDFSHAARVVGARNVDHRRLTGAHEVPGTAQYMAPEQARAVSAAPAMDVYALGLVLHEMVTGRAPFAGLDRSTCIDLRSRHALEVAPLDPRVYPDFSREFIDLIAACLQEGWQRRPSSDSVVARLESLGGARPRGPAPEQRKWLPPAVDQRQPLVRPQLPRLIETEVVEAVAVEWDPKRTRRRRAALVLVVLLAVALPSVVWFASSPSPRASWGLVALPVPPSPSVPSVVVPTPHEPAASPSAIDTGPEPAVGHSETRPHRKRSSKRRRRATVRARRVSTPSNKATGERCHDVRQSAHDAGRHRQWTTVLAHTRSEQCWSADANTRGVLRAQALMNLSRWAECAALGRQVDDERVHRWAARCEARATRSGDPS
ncbi:MAG: serine/threonine-protein kinase [Myxococcota bacterium]